MTDQPRAFEVTLITRHGRTHTVSTDPDTPEGLVDAVEAARRLRRPFANVDVTDVIACYAATAGRDLDAEPADDELIVTIVLDVEDTGDHSGLLRVAACTETIPVLVKHMIDEERLGFTATPGPDGALTVTRRAGHQRPPVDPGTGAYVTMIRHDQQAAVTIDLTAVTAALIPAAAPGTAHGIPHLNPDPDPADPDAPRFTLLVRTIDGHQHTCTVSHHPDGTPYPHSRRVIETAVGLINRVHYVRMSGPGDTNTMINTNAITSVTATPHNPDPGPDAAAEGERARSAPGPTSTAPTRHRRERADTDDHDDHDHTDIGE